MQVEKRLLRYLQLIPIITLTQLISLAIFFEVFSLLLPTFISLVSLYLLLHFILLLPLSFIFSAFLLPLIFTSWTSLNPILHFMRHLSFIFWAFKLFIFLLLLSFVPSWLHLKTYTPRILSHPLCFLQQRREEFQLEQASWCPSFEQWILSQLPRIRRSPYQFRPRKGYLLLQQHHQHSCSIWLFFLHSWWGSRLASTSFIFGTLRTWCFGNASDANR